ncbi:MAG: ABC transporter substrate-binding protein [Eubacteriales bacterium]|nr:ABC transporter substrate-binding protein [Eubacteriales bacterium]
MKKTFIMVLCLMLSVALLAGCSGTAPKTTDSDTIKIGINYELSGDVATYGQSSVEGIELAVEQLNAAGGIDGKKIQLVKYDNKSEPSEATALGKKLMTQDKVVAILGPATSGSFKATIPDAMKNKIPIASGSATADDVTVNKNGDVNNYAFRICFSDSYQGTAMAKFAVTKFKAKKAVVIMDSSSDYGKGLAENFVKTFEADGGEIVAKESYVSKDTDFNAILTNIKTKKFDVIFIPGYYNEAGLIIKQARGQGIKAPILGADGFDSPTLLELAGADALNDIYFSNHYSSLDKDELVQNFIADFKAKYNREPDAFNALGYDLAKFVVEGIGRAEALDGESVQKSLASTKGFKGVTGSFDVDKNNNPVKAIVVVGLENGVPATSEKLASN